MLPPSSADAGQTQVVPGKIWVATLCSILLLVAYGFVFFSQPDRLRESMLLGAQPAPVSLDKLAIDRSRDPRHVILRGVRVESVEERAGRDDATEGIHRIHLAGELKAASEPKLFVFAPGALLSGSDGEASGKQSDLREASELTGVLRRPNPLAYRVGAISDDCGIPSDAWLLHLDQTPYQPAETMLVGGAFLLLGGLMLMAMMSQNWIPNRGLNFQLLFSISCLWGWPLRRHRNSWPVRMTGLAVGSSLIVAGYLCVRTGDQGIVTDAYWLEYWAAAIGLSMLGLATVLRVGWVICRAERVASTATDNAQSEPLDDRPAHERPFTKFIASLRTVSGGVGVALILARIINNTAGRPVAILDETIVQYAIAGSLVTYSCSHWLLISITRGFSERAFTPVTTAPHRLTAYRERSGEAMELAGFELQGAYRVRGSAFHTTTEVHLGCKGMVVAEFISLSGKRAIELVSILDSGLCVTTATCKAPDGKPATRWSDTFYSHCAGSEDFEAVLRQHLGAVADLAEKHETSVTVLSKDDAVDVIRYSNRAFHDMLFQQGESKDRVGPAQYGRFRFPTGLSAGRSHESDGTANDANTPEAVGEVLDADTQEREAQSNGEEFDRLESVAQH